jgi:hypothetical protein
MARVFRADHGPSTKDTGCGAYSIRFCELENEDVEMGKILSRVSNTALRHLD